MATDSLRFSGRLRIQVRGESMLPTLWPGDVVEIASCSLADVRPGEIVLAIRDHRFFLHRFLAFRQDGFLLHGDCMPAPDPQFPHESFLGRLVNCADSPAGRAQAGPIFPLHPWSRAIGWVLCHCDPARSLALKIHGGGKQKVREIRSAADPASRETDHLGMDFETS